MKLDKNNKGCTMTKHLWILLILVLFSSCYKNDKAAAGYQAIQEFSKKKCKENTWRQQVCGGGFSGDDFNLVLGFVVCDQFYTVPQVRKIYVDTLEEFLNYLNNNEKIKKYATHFPLTYKDIEFSIAFRDSQNTCALSESIALVSRAHNNIYYDVRKYNDSSYNLYTVHAESYPDALCIVKVDPNYIPKPVPLLNWEEGCKVAGTDEQPHNLCIDGLHWNCEYIGESATKISWGIHGAVNNVYKANHGFVSNILEYLINTARIPTHPSHLAKSYMRNWAGMEERVRLWIPSLGKLHGEMAVNSFNPATRNFFEINSFGSSKCFDIAGVAKIRHIVANEGREAYFETLEDMAKEAYRNDYR